MEDGANVNLIRHVLIKSAWNTKVWYRWNRAQHSDPLCNDLNNIPAVFDKNHSIQVGLYRTVSLLTLL